MESLALTKRTICRSYNNYYSNYYHRKNKIKELSPDYYISINYRFENKKRFLDVKILFKDKNDIFNNFKNLNEDNLFSYLDDDNLFSYLDDEEVKITLHYDEKVSEEPYLLIALTKKEKRRFVIKYESLNDRSVPLERKFRGSLEEGLNEFYILLFSKNIQLDYSINKFIFLRSEFSGILYSYLLRKELDDILKESFLNKNDRLINKVYNETINYPITYKVKTKSDFFNLTKDFKKIALESGLENFSKEINIASYILKLISFVLRTSIFLLFFLAFSSSIVINIPSFIHNAEELLSKWNWFQFIFCPPFGLFCLCSLNIASLIAVSIPANILYWVLSGYLHLKAYMFRRSFVLDGFVAKKVFDFNSNKEIFMFAPMFYAEVIAYEFIYSVSLYIFIAVWTVSFLFKSIIVIISFFLT